VQFFISKIKKKKSVILHLGKLKKYYGDMGVSNAFYGTTLIIASNNTYLEFVPVYSLYQHLYRT